MMISYYPSIFSQNNPLSGKLYEEKIYINKPQSRFQLSGYFHLSKIIGKIPNEFIARPLLQPKCHRIWM
jgi:hypothetical protein